MQKKNDQKCDLKNRFYSALLSQGGTTGLLHGGEGASQRKALTVYQRGFTSGASLRGYRHAEKGKDATVADLFAAIINFIN